MKKLIFLIIAPYFFSQLNAQALDEPLAVLGENVMVYYKPDERAATGNFLAASSELVGHEVIDGWYLIRQPSGSQGYVPHWDVIELSLVEPSPRLLPKRITPSASTLFRMMKYFKQKDKLDKAGDFALRIINTHNNEEYPTKDKACFKLGHLAYMHMISEEDRGVRYDAFLLAFTQKVLAESEATTLKAMAYYHQARYHALNGSPSKAMDNLLNIVADYPEEFSRNECQPNDLNSWFYKPERSKRLFCALSMIMPAHDLKPVTSRLEFLISDGSDNSKLMARELHDNMGSMPYAKEDSIWY